jgi:hypothetical protein
MSLKHHYRGKIWQTLQVRSKNDDCTEGQNKLLGRTLNERVDFGKVVSSHLIV